MKSQAIYSERLLIRRFQPSDYLDLHEYLSDPKVVKFEPYEPFTLEQSKTEAANRAKNTSFWAVCLRDTNKVIGNIYFNEEDFGTYELGYVFNNNYQKHGYATESCSVFLKYAFEELKVRRVIALCSTENISSWRLMERLNMRKEGHFLQNVSFKNDANGNPIYFDAYQYAILQSEYMANCK